MTGGGKGLRHMNLALEEIDDPFEPEPRRATAVQVYSDGSKHPDHPSTPQHLFPGRTGDRQLTYV